MDRPTVDRGIDQNQSPPKTGAERVQEILYAAALASFDRRVQNDPALKKLSVRARQSILKYTTSLASAAVQSKREELESDLAKIHADVEDTHMHDDYVRASAAYKKILADAIMLAHEQKSSAKNDSGEPEDNNFLISSTIDEIYTSKSWQEGNLSDEQKRSLDEAQKYLREAARKYDEELYESSNSKERGVDAFWHHLKERRYASLVPFLESEQVNTIKRYVPLATDPESEEKRKEHQSIRESCIDLLAVYVLELFKKKDYDEMARLVTGLDNVQNKNYVKKLFERINLELDPTGEKKLSTGPKWAERFSYKGPPPQEQ